MTALQEYSTLYWNKIAEEEQQRLNAYRRAWKYYHSTQRATLFTKFGAPNDNLIFNMYAYIIDKGVSFLFGKDVAFQLEEGVTTEDETLLASVWDENEKMSLLQDVALNGGNCGHCFIEICPNEEFANGFELINHDPANIRPQWDSRNIKRVIWYKDESHAIDPKTMKVTYYKRLIERQDDGTWLITKFIQRVNDRDYVQDGEPILWDYPFPPIVDWKNLPAPNEYFGRPDVEGLDGQDAINFNFSNSQRIYRYHGHPKTIGKGFKADTVSIAPDEMIVLPDKDSDVFNLEMQGNLDSAREDRKLLITTFLQTNHVPNLGDVDAALGAVSGTALKVRYGDLLSRTETKRLLYGNALKEVNRRLLILAGKNGTKTTRLMWQSPLPENPVDLTDVLTKQVDAGFTSKETAQQELGRDTVTEKARIEAERLEGDSLGGQLLRAFNSGNIGQ